MIVAFIGDAMAATGSAKRLLSQTVIKGYHYGQPLPLSCVASLTVYGQHYRMPCAFIGLAVTMGRHAIHLRGKTVVETGIDYPATHGSMALLAAIGNDRRMVSRPVRHAVATGFIAAGLQHTGMVKGGV